MNGLLYGIFVVGILFVIRWYIQNERAGTDSDGSIGLLAMRAPGKPTAKRNLVGNPPARPDRSKPL